MSTWSGPAVVDMGLSDLQRHAGRVRPELASGAVIRLVNRKTGFIEGGIVPAWLLARVLEGAEHLLEAPWHVDDHEAGRRGAAVTNGRRVAVSTVSA